ncbi:MAG: hypothetical protein JNK21_10340 [Rhodospirillaceae bacterium]|nr:hypothetical protein [Rhodospirillaceae bacterium]
MGAQFRIVLILAALAAAPSLGSTCLAQTATPENTGPNTNIVRWAKGTYAYQTISDKRARGSERFYLNVHPDGSRSMIMWHDLAARNAQFSVMLRVAANFRPLEAYATYWTAPGYKGSALMTVAGDTLSIVSNGPLGVKTDTVKVPERFSIGTHPVSGDGWHMWYETADLKGPQKDGMIYSMEASADNTKPVMGTLRPLVFERIGPEKITVPAGTFETVRYKLSEVADMWVLPQDRLTVRQTNTLRDLDYVLTEYAAGGAK